MKDQGYGKDYRYAHDEPQGVAAMPSLPEGLRDREYYRPKDVGWEGRISKRLQALRALIRSRPRP